MFIFLIQTLFNLLASPREFIHPSLLNSYIIQGSCDPVTSYKYSMDFRLYFNHYYVLTDKSFSHIVLNIIAHRIIHVEHAIHYKSAVYHFLTWYAISKAIKYQVAITFPLPVQLYSLHMLMGQVNFTNCQFRPLYLQYH